MAQETRRKALLLASSSGLYELCVGEPPRRSPRRRPRRWLSREICDARPDAQFGDMRRSAFGALPPAIQHGGQDIFETGPLQKALLDVIRNKLVQLLGETKIIGRLADALVVEPAELLKPPTKKKGSRSRPLKRRLGSQTQQEDLLGLLNPCAIERQSV
jgi:hypothetical protein